MSVLAILVCVSIVNYALMLYYTIEDPMPAKHFSRVLALDTITESSGDILAKVNPHDVILSRVSAALHERVLKVDARQRFRENDHLTACSTLIEQSLQVVLSEHLCRVSHAGNTLLLSTPAAFRSSSISPQFSTKLHLSLSC